MRKLFPGLILAIGLLGASPACAQGILNLSCMEALAAVGEEDLAGVFSFINEDDSTVAFADLVVHRRRVRRKYIDKVRKDLKKTGGISAWDHQVVLRIKEIYGSALAEILEKPSVGTMQRLQKFSISPTLTLDELTSKRKKGRGKKKR